MPLFYLDPMCCSALNMLADAVTAPNSQDIKIVKEAANDGSDEASNSKKPIKFMASSFAALIKDDDEDSIKEKKRIILKGKSAAVMNNPENDDIFYQDWVAFKPSPTKLVQSNRKRQRFNVVDAANDDGSHEASNSKKPIKFMASSFAAYSSLKFRLHPNKRIVNNAADLQSTSKNGANFMGSTIEEGATSKDDDDDDDTNLLIKEKKRRDLKDNDAENDDVINQDLVTFNHSLNKLVGSSSNRKRQQFNIVVDAAPSELPQEFKDKINELDPAFVSKGRI